MCILCARAQSIVLGSEVTSHGDASLVVGVATPLTAASQQMTPSMTFSGRWQEL